MSDEANGAWLREAMVGEVPELSRGFDAAVLARTRRRALTSKGRLLMAVYAAVALALSAWAMQDAGAALVLASTFGGAVVAAGLSGYLRTVLASRRQLPGSG